MGVSYCCFFFLNDTATTDIYTYSHTLSLHVALPILQVHDHRVGIDLRPAHDEGRERIQLVEQEVRIDLIMECAKLRILRLEPIGVGAPLDRAHLVRIAERDIERGPDGEKEIPADRAVEDEHQYPRHRESGPHLGDDPLCVV